MLPWMMRDVWVFVNALRFAQAQKKGRKWRDKASATLRNYIKAVKLFCEMNDIVGLNWKKIRRMLPRL
jgi:hypothetical protein